LGERNVRRIEALGKTTILKPDSEKDTIYV